MTSDQLIHHPKLNPLQPLPYLEGLFLRNEATEALRQPHWGWHHNCCSVM
ncbi:hypothetical protein SynTAK9802_00946 [Synechococcus sp. TAK9802]|nr:hypothetical protein SynTAK9802_00946 [Synechococcus sp. TAK9802]